MKAMKGSAVHRLPVIFLISAAVVALLLIGAYVFAAQHQGSPLHGSLLNGNKQTSEDSSPNAGHHKHCPPQARYGNGQIGNPHQKGCGHRPPHKS